MSESDISRPRDEVTNGYHETDFHGSRIDRLLRNNRVQIDGDEWTLSTVVEVERLRRRYASEYRSLMECVADPTRRGVIAALVREVVSTYSDLSTWVSTTVRTVKSHVHALRDENIVAVEDGRPATVSFRNDEIRLLASDVLSFV